MASESRSRSAPSLHTAGTLSDRFLRGLLAAVTATPFVYIPGVLYPSVVPRAVYFRLLVVGAALVLAVAWARGGKTAGVRRWRRERVGLGLAAFTAVAFFSAVAGAAPIEGLLGGMVRMEGASAWLSYLLFYLVLRAVLDEEAWQSFLRMVAAVSVVVAGWSLVQAYGESVGVALVGWGSDRVVGTLGLEGPLAIYMLLGAAVAGYLAADASGRIGALGWGLVAALDLWVVALTGTRSVLVAGAASVLALGCWAMVTTDRDSRIRRVAVRTVAGLVVAILGLLLLGDGAFPAVGRMVDIGSDALSSRLHLWRSAWAGFLEQPLLGAGLESFDLVYDRHFRAEDYLASGAAHHDRAHNVILGAMAETGILGLAAYLAFWAAAFAGALSALRGSEREPGLYWLAAGVGACFVYLLLWFEDLASFHVLLVILAFLEHRRLTDDPEGGGEEDGGGRTAASPGPGGGRHRGRWAMAAGAAVLLLATGWYHLQVVGAAREVRRGMAAGSATEFSRHFARALDYRTATTREITSRYVGGLEGLASRVRSGREDPEAGVVAAAFGRGERAVRAEIARHPAHSLVHGRLGRLHQARWRWSGGDDDFRRAVEGYRRALDRSPDRVRYLHQLARLHTQNGNPERAMSLLERALDRLPGWWETYNTMAQVQWDAGNRERAVELLLRAARTDVRSKTAGTGTQFMVRAGSWLEARGTPMQAVELFEAYLGTRYPGWDEPGGPAGTEVPAAALPIAARLPITLMHAGRIDEAGRAARRLRERLPPHLRRPVVTDRLDRFVADMEAGRVDRWRDAWGVLPTDVPLGG